MKLDAWGFCHIHGLGVMLWDMAILVLMLRAQYEDSILWGCTFVSFNKRETPQKFTVPSGLSAVSLPPLLGCSTVTR